MSNNQHCDEQRAKLYKNSGKPEDLRRRRIETSVELRRQRQQDEMMKRRQIDLDLNSSDSSIDRELYVASSVTSLEDAISMIANNPTIDQIRMSFEFIRRLLSRNKDPPIDQIISSGLLVALVNGIEGIKDESIQFEAAWAITNILSGSSEQTAAAINAGAIRSLFSLFQSGSLKLVEQAVWALANIAGDSAHFRDLLINNGIVFHLTNICQKLDQISTSFARTLTWAFSNICRHKKPQVSHEILKQLIPNIEKLLGHSDEIVRQDACWALTFITDGPDENIELATKLLNHDILRMLTSDDDAQISPALRVLGNFTTGKDELTQMVIDMGVLNIIRTVLIKRSGSIMNGCCWLISNVLAGTQEQIQYVIDAQLVPHMLDILKNGDHRSQYEASWAVANLGNGGTINQILEILRINGAAESICDCLSVKSNELISNLLEILYVLLSTTSQSNNVQCEKLKLLIEECGGLDKLEQLQESKSEKIYEMTYKIIDEFFMDNEELGEDGQTPDLENTEFNF